MLEPVFDSLISVPRGLVYVALGLVMLYVAKLVRDLLTRHPIDEEVIQKQNRAEALRLSGYLFGVILVFSGATFHPGGWVIVSQDLGFNQQFGLDVLKVALYTLAGIVALNLVRLLMDRLILYKFKMEEEVIDQQNTGAGAAAFGINIAAGLTIAGAIAGEGGPEIALAFFILGLAVLVAFSLVYEWTTHQDIHREIEQNNPAVGIAFAGNLVAIGLVNLKALLGSFNGWAASTVEFLLFAVLGFILLYALRWLVDLVFFPKANVSRQLAEGRNTGVAFVESAVVISSALILFWTL